MREERANGRHRVVRTLSRRTPVRVCGVRRSAVTGAPVSRIATLMPERRERRSIAGELHCLTPAGLLTMPPPPAFFWGVTCRSLGPDIRQSACQGRWVNASSGQRVRAGERHAHFCFRHESSRQFDARGNDRRDTDRLHEMHGRSRCDGCSAVDRTCNAHVAAPRSATVADSKVFRS